MNIIIDFNDRAKTGVKKSFIDKIIRETVNTCALSFLEKKFLNFSLASVSGEKIAELNRRYRRKNSVTDVLSFPEFRKRSELVSSSEKEAFLGEIIFCYNDIEEYARKNKLNFQKELAKVISHGALHLLHFRHGEKMFAIQNKIAEKY